MKHEISKRWFLSGLKGLLAVIFGLFALLWTEITLVTLAIWFGLFIIAGGVFQVVAALLNRKLRDTWKYWPLEAFIDVILGVIIISFPELTVSVFLIVLGIWALLSGVLLIVAYMKLKKVAFERYLSLAGGLLSIIFGIIFILKPFQSASVMMIFIGIFALIYGLISIFTSIKMARTISVEVKETKETV